MRILSFTLFVVAVLAIAADKVDPEPAPVAPPKADIRGKITNLAPAKVKNLYGSILVEGTKEKDTQHDKASIRLASDTTFYKWVGGKKVKAAFADLKVGQKVQATFVGPVAESYPVQARAGEVLILPGK